MDSLIHQDGFEPYYAGKQSLAAPKQAKPRAKVKASPLRKPASRLQKSTAETGKAAKP